MFFQRGKKDLDGNVDRVLAALAEAEDQGCDLAVFPELAITGYPPEDLLLKPGFVGDNRPGARPGGRPSRRCAAVVGFVDAGRDLYNAAAVCAFGEVQAVYHKHNLPNYAVFDEQRYFAPGTGRPPLVEVAGVRVGVSICEDAFSPTGPIAAQAAGGAELVVNINASPYYANRLAERERMLATRASDAACALVYVNQVGGQDELVFDGASMVFDAHGELLARAGQFTEETLICDVEVQPVFRKRLLDPRGAPPTSRCPWSTSRPAPRFDDPSDVRRPAVADPLPPVREVYEALVTGTRDYVRKNGFTDVAIALSGGIDSSLVAVIATDALGPEHVHGVLMPSRYSSDHSLTDAEKLAVELGIEHRVIPIEPAHAAFVDMLAPSFEGLEPDVTEENLQSRIRGVVMMALSNKFRGWLVLTTGNKSEMAVGYSTPLRRHRRRVRGHQGRAQAAGLRAVPRPQRPGRPALVPDEVLTKPPSAELRPDQRDDQSLPPYEVLDPILEAYVEDDRTRAELVGMGFDAAMVERITRLVDTAEYKRRQTPPGRAGHPQGVRQGPPGADHQPLPRVTAPGPRLTGRRPVSDPLERPGPQHPGSPPAGRPGSQRRSCRP